MTSLADLSARAAEALDAALAPLSLADRLRRAAAAAPGRAVFTTSFGLEDQAIAQAIAESGAEIRIVTLDTGRLFPETYELWAETERRYGLKIFAHHPKAEHLARLTAAQGPMGFRESLEARQACCGARKVAPLAEALAGAGVWITGLRADQSRQRGAARLAEWDMARGLLKVSPLVDWTRERLAGHIRLEEIPYNPLHDQGYPSIGCQPCTRAVRVGEDERAGRWWWENDAKKECGLHVAGARAAV